MSAPLLTLALLAAAAAGCASTGAAARDPGTDCAGLSVLTVMNNSGHDVLIMEQHHSTNATSTIATLGGGTHDITVRSEADYSYRAVAADRGSIEVQRRVSRGNTVRLRRECRPPAGEGA